MSNCRICGRPLSAPSSVSAGIGPICGGRNYKGRIHSRYSLSGGGWSEIEEWEKVNSPCYSCTLFQFPKKGDEVKDGDGFLVRANGLSMVFEKEAIGGYCRYYNILVDGNTINEHTRCKGNMYIARKKKEDLPTVGLLYDAKGDPNVYDI